LGTHSREAAQRILARAARETAFQVQTGVPAIWVSGQLLDPWLDYGGLWVSGCNDEQWPPPVAPIALLPISVQRQYGVIPASAESQLALAIDLQNRWQQRANQCVFSLADSGAGSGDGSSSMPSPLLPKIAPLDLPLSAAPQPHWRKMQAAAPALASLWDEQAPPHGGSERTRGVGTLRAQSRCAFRGFAETRLDVEALEQPVPGFNERERGELVHHALQHIWTVLRDSSSLQAVLPDVEHHLIDAAAAAQLSSCAGGATRGGAGVCVKQSGYKICWENGCSSSEREHPSWSKPSRGAIKPHVLAGSNSACAWIASIDCRMARVS
jgi:hypothetical protein